MEEKKRNKGRDVHVVPHYLIAFLVVLVLKNPTVSSTTQEDDRVDSLPGMESFNVSFAHYAGYVTVDNVSGRSIFYWFFEAVEDPSSKPLVLWLTGGPGCSSMAFGMAEEVGPFHIKPDGKTLYLNPYSWNQVANLLFIDSPVGVGFSYSNNSWDRLTNGDARTAVDSLVFLKEWLKRFPEYEGRDFYITGESYAGHYIPQLAQAIVLSQQWMWKKSINLKGYMVGNALTDDYNDYLGLFEYWWTVGLISDETYKLLNFFCKHDSYLKPGPQCKKIYDVARQEMGNIDIYSIDSPACIDNGTASNRLLERLQLGALFSEQYDPCTTKYSTVYFNLPEVQKALHVIPELAPTKWIPCSDVVRENWKDSPTSVLDIYRQLIISGLRIWMFSGDTDARIPVTSTRYNIDALNLPKVSPWRAWYDGDQVGGWIQGYKGLTFVTVRGAGLKVAKYEPKLALSLFNAFLSGTTLPASTEDTTGLISGSQPSQLVKM